MGRAGVIGRWALTFDLTRSAKYLCWLDLEPLPLGSSMLAGLGTVGFSGCLEGLPDGWMAMAGLLGWSALNNMLLA